MAKFQSITPRGKHHDVGVGNTLRLTATQYYARKDAGSVKLVRADGDKFICESTKPIMFKVGDAFELAE